MVAMMTLRKIIQLSQGFRLAVSKTQRRSHQVLFGNGWQAHVDSTSLRLSCRCSPLTMVAIIGITAIWRLKIGMDMMCKKLV